MISGSFTVRINAYTSSELCEAWASHAATPWKLLDLYNAIRNAEGGSLGSIALALYQYAISNKTSGFVSQACEADPDMSEWKNARQHGGHGGYWDDAIKSADDDLKNGTNRNYYLTPDRNNTSNYNIVSNTNNVSNINYTYNNQTYNYTTNIENNYYNISNNSYNFYFNETDYLTYINTYNNTTIIYNGDTTELYYRLPDGSDSYNLTEEEAYNGYKTSLSVSSYENTYDSDDLEFLFHFDDNEYDLAYPTSTVLSFSKNSVNYVNDLNFNHAVAFNGESTISVNKSNLYYSFRFYPLMDDELYLNINGSFIGGSKREYQTITSYDEFYNEYLVQRTQSPTAGYIRKVGNLYIVNPNSTTSFCIVARSLSDAISYFNDYYPYLIIEENPVLSSVSGTFTASSVYNPDNIDISSYYNGNRYVFNFTEQSLVYLYDPTSYVSNRSYNYINYDFYINQGVFNLVNLGMWNFICILIDGSVYINGIDTGIDVDNTQNLSLEFTGDSVFYFDEFFGNNVNRSVIAPSRPYDSNIVYYLPDEFQNNCILIQSLISVTQYKFGGIRPSSPVLGYVYISVNEVGNITSVQQFNGIEWIGVNAGIYNEYLDLWINVIGFNIFNNNWDYQDLNYMVEDNDSNNLIKFLTTQFNRVINAIRNINGGDDNSITNNLENNYDIDTETDINNYIQNVKDRSDDVDLNSPEFNLDPDNKVSLFAELPEATLGIFIQNNLGIFIFLPILIGILGLVL